MNCTTEFEINFPTEKEVDTYTPRVYAAIEDFLDEQAEKYKRTIGVKYICRNRHNQFSFKWNAGSTEAEIAESCKKMEKFFYSNKFMKKHSICNVATVYNIF